MSLDPALCPVCKREIDESRAVETNYLIEDVVDWYPCAGCLTAFGVEWVPYPGIGDDGWQMIPTQRIVLSGSAVAHEVERLRAGVEGGEGQSALRALRSKSESRWLLRIPEVVAVAWPAFGGSARTAASLTFEVYSTAHDLVIRLDPATPEEETALAAQREYGGIRMPVFTGGGERRTAMIDGGTKLQLVGCGGPFSHARPLRELWKGFRHFEVTLDCLVPDPEAP